VPPSVEGSVKSGALSPTLSVEDGAGAWADRPKVSAFAIKTIVRNRIVYSL
jgi:hypothetical protein